jgi:hypothetical protein
LSIPISPKRFFVPQNILRREDCAQQLLKRTITKHMGGQKTNLYASTIYHKCLYRLGKHRENCRPSQTEVSMPSYEYLCLDPKFVETSLPGQPQTGEYKEPSFEEVAAVVNEGWRLHLAVPRYFYQRSQGQIVNSFIFERQKLT